jgi:isopentenyl phosphate kinase
MIILKIGGSALTDKKTGESFISEVSERVSRELPKDKKIAIVHGVGYTGHKLAKEYMLHKGLQDNADKWAHLRTEVKNITKEIVGTMVKGGHNAIELSVTSSMRTSQGRLVYLDFEILKEFISRGFIPVLHGDGVLDDTYGLVVISGDKIATELALCLKADMIIYGTDVDGILDSNSNVIPEITGDNFPNIDIKDNGDFSGGLKNKIVETMRLKGTEVKIINLRKDGVLKKALQNEKVGTIIRSFKK